MKVMKRVTTTTEFHFDDTDLDDIIRDEVRSKNPELFTGSNQTVQVEYTVSTGGFVTGAVATVTRHEES